MHLYLFLFGLILGFSLISAGQQKPTPVQTFANCVGDRICNLQKESVSVKAAVHASKRLCNSDQPIQIDIIPSSGSTAQLHIASVYEKVHLLVNCPDGLDSFKDDDCIDSNPTPKNAQKTVKDSIEFVQATKIDCRDENEVPIINGFGNEQRSKFGIGFKKSKSKKCEHICYDPNRPNRTFVQFKQKNKSNYIVDSVFKHKNLSASLPEPQVSYACVQCGDPKYFAKAQYNKLKSETNSCVDKDGCTMGNEKRSVYIIDSQSGQRQRTELCTRICSEDQTQNADGFCENKDKCKIYKDILIKLNKSVVKMQTTHFVFGTCQYKDLKKLFDEYFQEQFGALNTSLDQCEAQSKTKANAIPQTAVTTPALPTGTMSSGVAHLPSGTFGMGMQVGVPISVKASFLDWLNEEYDIHKKCHIPESMAPFLTNDPFIQFASENIITFMGENTDPGTANMCDEMGICPID